MKEGRKEGKSEGEVAISHEQNYLETKPRCVSGQLECLISAEAHR